MSKGTCTHCGMFQCICGLPKKKPTISMTAYNKLRTDLAAVKEENRFLERQYKNTDSRIERLLKKLTSQNKYKADLKRLKDAVKKTLQAWDSLETGDYNPEIVEKWLLDKMKPAMIIARKALNPKETHEKAV